MNLTALKIIVTGAASGTGRHFSRRLVEAGAQVAGGDINTDVLANLAAECRSLPGEVHPRSLNVAVEKYCEGFVAWAHDAMGGLNGLINNAAILRDGLLVKKDGETRHIKKLPRQQWQAVIDVNLTSATIMAWDVVAGMLETGAAPGVIETLMTQGMSQKVRDALVAAIPLRRIRQPEELGIAVKSVLECGYFTGRTIDVDGGIAA